MSSSSSSGFVLATDNFARNNEHTTKIQDDEIRNTDLTDFRPPGVDPTSKTASDKLRMPCGHKLNARNLIVCIDGTSSHFGTSKTHVKKVYNLTLDNDGDHQRKWYVNGIGAYAKPPRKSINFYMKIPYYKIDQAIALKFEKGVVDAYRWLSDNYEEDDCIFLFGFSRGAFQVRVLSAMIEKVGLVYKGNEQIPYAYELYAERKADEANHFKKTFSHENVTVHFVGAWDTVSSIAVSSIGRPFPPGTREGMTHVCHFRHALALDERRVTFSPEYAYEGSAIPPGLIDNTRESKGTPPQTKEVWFAGRHSDIGGGIVKYAYRSGPPLRWMVLEARAAGLRTAARFEDHEQTSIISSVASLWRLFKILTFKRPTLTRNKSGFQSVTLRPHLGSPRKIHQGQKIHRSVVRALGAGCYIPKACPFNNDLSFWEMLGDKDKGPTSNFSEWLEFDLYERSRFAVEKLATEGDDTALKSLLHTYSSVDTEVVLRNVIEARQKGLQKSLLERLLQGSSPDDWDFTQEAGEFLYNRLQS